MEGASGGGGELGSGVAGKLQVCVQRYRSGAPALLKEAGGLNGVSVGEAKLQAVEGQVTARIDRACRAEVTAECLCGQGLDGHYVTLGLNASCSVAEDERVRGASIEDKGIHVQSTLDPRPGAR